MQLRWRPYQSSERASHEGNGCEESDLGNSTNFTDVEVLNKISNIKHSVHVRTARIDGLENVLKGRLYMFSTLHRGKTEECREEVILATLRNKIVLLMQRSIPPAGMRDKGSATTNACHDVSMGSLKAEADFSLRDFQVICRQIQCKTENALFLPSYVDIQEPSVNMDVFESNSLFSTIFVK